MIVICPLSAPSRVILVVLALANKKYCQRIPLYLEKSLNLHQTLIIASSYANFRCRKLSILTYIFFFGYWIATSYITLIWKKASIQSNGLGGTGTKYILLHSLAIKTKLICNQKYSNLHIYIIALKQNPIWLYA